MKRDLRQAEDAALPIPPLAPSTVDPVGDTQSQALHNAAAADAARVYLGAGWQPEPPPVARQFAGYEILGHIAQGGMGDIYRALDTRLGRTVALKMLRAGNFWSADDVRRFYLEARAIAQLKHAHIVPIYDIGETDGRHYFTMALATGSLASQAARQHVDAGAVVRLLIKICQAIDFAHEKGVLHRDLKPSNILIDEHGEPLVSDFGIAKFFEQDLDITRTGEILGTPAFMAPEQAAAETWRICRQSDVWSLGVMLYELLTGRRPFSGGGPDQVRQAIQKVDPTPPRQIDGSIDRDLEVIILKCLEKVPADRYPTAASLADDLHRWLEGEPIVARRRSWPARLARRARKRPLAPALLALVMLATVTAVVVARINDPQRVLANIHGQLQSGGSVTLIPDTGMPQWHQWVLPNANSSVSQHADGTLLVADWDRGLLELISDPQWPEYRISAELRHLDGNNASRVGLYFGRSAVPHGAGSEMHWCDIAFSDRRTGDLGRGPGINTLALLEINRHVRMLDGKVLANLSFNTDVKHYFASAAPLLAAAGELDQAPWRKLTVEVLHDKVCVGWEGQAIGETTWDDLWEKQSSLKREPPGPVEAGVDPRGGLGLFVTHGVVGVRNMMVEPIGSPRR